jgi:dishevelled associated activator of morphogenesis
VQVSGVLEACKEVQRSKRLRKMLEIILAFGNYMNRGQRGNALGFKLNSLTRIADTKSSCNKNMTLLHFMADTCEKKVSVFCGVADPPDPVRPPWIRIRIR